MLHNIFLWYTVILNLKHVSEYGNFAFNVYFKTKKLQIIKLWYIQPTEGEVNKF